MADQQNSHPWWQQVLGALVAALAPLVVKGVLSGVQALENALTPWDGRTERRGGSPPAAPPQTGP